MYKSDSLAEGSSHSTQDFTLAELKCDASQHGAPDTAALQSWVQ